MIEKIAILGYQDNRDHYIEFIFNGRIYGLYWELYVEPTTFIMRIKRYYPINALLSDTEIFDLYDFLKNYINKWDKNSAFQ